MKAFGYGIGDHEREAGSIYYRRDGFVDLLVRFVERDRGGDGLLHCGDGGEPRRAPLQLGDQLSRQRTPP
jgi:hypothetical protein